MSESVLENSTNFFLTGNFAPVRDERDLDDLPVEGAIPTDLMGHFLRIGPNPVYVFDPERYHTFDGDGMIHAIEFAGGTIRYRNRFVESEGLQLERERGDWIYKGLNSMLDPTPSRIPENGPSSKNLANTAMVYHNNTFYALHEASQPTVIKLPTLETEGATDFAGKLTHPFTAHPKVDPNTGEMMTYGYSFEAPYVNYSVISATGELVHSTPVTIPKPVFMHDFAVTENYSVFLDFPITLDIERAINGGPALAFEAEHGARIGIMPRFGSDDDVRWFTVETGVAIHTANAWEEGDTVVIQASRSQTADIIGAGTSVDVDLEATQGKLYEWRIDLANGSVTERQLSAIPCDFTRINDNFACHQTRYVYAAVFDPQRPFSFAGIMKYDNQTNTTTRFKFGADRYGGEAVFAPRANAQTEDDGYLICFVQDEQKDRSECLVFDAQCLDDGPVATIMMPCRVPYGFHADWVASTSPRE